MKGNHNNSKSTFLLDKKSIGGCDGGVKVILTPVLPLLARRVNASFKMAAEF
jgi:hypothetical protein